MNATLTTSEYLESCEQLTLQEVVERQQQNHVASQGVRSSIRLMVGQRLAKEISLERFRSDHSSAIELQSILHSRHIGLSAEITRRRHEFSRVANMS